MGKFVEFIYSLKKERQREKTSNTNYILFFQIYNTGVNRPLARCDYLTLK